VGFSLGYIVEPAYRDVIREGNLIIIVDASFLDKPRFRGKSDSIKLFLEPGFPVNTLIILIKLLV
jgi:hypothetical protein